MLALVAILVLPSHQAHALKMAVTQFFSPLLTAATHVRQAAERDSASESSSAPNVEAEELRQENARLREMIGFRERTPWRLLGARVIGRDASNWWRTITLDRGRADGVSENMAVLTPAGLVGKTYEVGQRFCRVLLIADPNCHVSALLQGSRKHGFVNGVGASSEAEPRCWMKFLDTTTTVAEGEWVLASGYGGVFPKGSIIGRVEFVNASGFYQTASIRPAADLMRLEEVLIVLGEKEK